MTRYGDMRFILNSVCVAGLIHVAQTNSPCLGNICNTFLNTVHSVVYM